MFNILLLASKKALTRKWLRTETPTVEDWTNVIHDIFVMEKLTFVLRLEQEKFEDCWKSWIEYVSPLRSDFKL